MDLKSLSIHIIFHTVKKLLNPIFSPVQRNVTFTLKLPVACKYSDGLILDIDNKKEVRGLLGVGSNEEIGRCRVIVIKDLYRNEGIGKRLYVKCLSYLKDKGKDEVTTTVSAKKLDSLNFHLKLSYNVVKINNIFHLRLNE